DRRHPHDHRKKQQPPPPIVIPPFLILNSKFLIQMSRPYAELRAASSFSFLEAASLPEDLIATAAERDVPAMAIIDRNGVYGAPRFYTAAKKTGVKALIGSELVMDHGRITLLVESRTGYKNLCKLI